MILDLDLERCISCGACAIACMDQNHIDFQNGDVPLRSVFTLEQPEQGRVRYTYLSLSCMHCEHAPCIMGCPTQSLDKDSKTGLTLYDTKCNGCAERVEIGLEPACVRVCPFNALTFYQSKEEYLEHKRRDSLRDLCNNILKV